MQNAELLGVHYKHDAGGDCQNDVTFAKQTSASMPVAKILIVEDEPAIREMVSYALRQSDFELLEAEDAQQAYGLIADHKPDLVLLDWMLPGQSGLEVARRLRKDAPTSELPIIMLTARGEESDRVRGLECGADDYISKPFSLRELIARIHALLRRSAPHIASPTLQHGAVRLDSLRHEVWVGKKQAEMGPTEFRLLRFLMAHPNRVYSRSQLLDQVWGQNSYIEERTIDVHILRLRKALGKKASGHIRTIHSAGYQFHTDLPAKPKKKSGKVKQRKAA